MASTSSPLTVVEQSTFYEDPSIYPGFTSNRQPLRYYGGRVMFLNKTTEDNEPRVFYANTIDELNHVRDELLSKPMVWLAEARHTSTQSYVVVRVTTTYNGRFAVMLNAGHPAVAGRLTQAIDQAMEHILLGEKYCIELDIGPALRRWFMHKIKQDPNRGTTEHTRITITNCSKYNHTFDCCSNSLWVCCLPCCLLSAPCYKIHRHRNVNDIQLDFGHLPVSHRVQNEGMVADILPSGEIAIVSVTLRGVADIVGLLEDDASNQTQALVTQQPQPAAPSLHLEYYPQTTGNPARGPQNAGYDQPQVSVGNTVTAAQYDSPPSYAEAIGDGTRTHP